MKKLIITLSLFFIVGNFSKAKAQNNFPVVGHTYVDTTMTIRDSLYLKNKLTVDDKAIFKNGIRVLENGRFENNLRVMETARVDRLVVDGNAIFKGNVRLDSIGNIPNGILNSGEYYQIVILPNGQIKKHTNFISADALPEGISFCPSGSEFVDVANPMWYSGLNKLVSPCPKVRVGVATQNPEYQLDVRGMIYSNFLKVGQINAEHNAFINCYASVSGIADLVNLGVYNHLDNQSQTSFRITKNGCVNISNSSSQTSLEMTNGTGKAIVIKKADGTKILQLENDGLLRSREIKIDQATWADYVFDKNYNLISLEEVAKYINKNKHLPGIPSQKQIARDGLNLGDMQRLQMEKIEELTLYTIQQDEQIKDLQNQVTHLQKELDEIKTLLLNAKN